MPDEVFVSTDPHNKKEITDSINIKETDVMSAIDQVSSNSATSPGRFQTILLKKCKGVFPELPHNREVSHKIKGRHCICPIHKEGRGADVKNYKSVFLTTGVSKVMENIVRKKLIMFLEDNDLLPDT